MCRYFKRLLNTTSRYTYIVDAYDRMKKWMLVGDEETLRVKKYVHRHLKLPEECPLVDPNEILIEFAYEYVCALLTYCSDNLKEGRSIR